MDVWDGGFEVPLEGEGGIVGILHCRIIRSIIVRARFPFGCLDIAADTHELFAHVAPVVGGVDVGLDPIRVLVKFLQSSQRFFRSDHSSDQTIKIRTQIDAANQIILFTSVFSSELQLTTPNGDMTTFFSLPFLLNGRLVLGLLGRFGILMTIGFL